ncbi:hypothetical protein AABB24_022801 [Solanum stoloniferum]|uniref:NAD-dependent epimerase/dehydratase domain-containing protein n=1 Tax=Solanum stoloniferum TaxID=62892 RepID=A0ABD2T149_9SOLN
MSTEKPPVCVTGANGFIGSWVVQTLLNRGYTTIHAAIFPGSDPSHLHSLAGASNPGVRILVHEVNILDTDAVSRAIAGCGGGGVFHVASPCTLEDPVDPQKELVEPAVQGTINVLTAAKKFNVRRVVLTSSISAMVPNPGWPENKVFDESSWTDLDYCKSRQLEDPVYGLWALLEISSGTDDDRPQSHSIIGGNGRSSISSAPYQRGCMLIWKSKFTTLSRMHMVQSFELSKHSLMLFHGKRKA